MKKQNLKSLKLNKRDIISFNNVQLNGGVPPSDRLCSGTCPTNGTCLKSECAVCEKTLDGASKCLIVCG